MTSKQRSDYTPTVLMSVLLVPLIAVVAFLLVSSPGDAAESAAETTTTTTPVTTTTTTIPEPAAVEDPVAAIELACGVDGWALVAKEADGSITPLEQAALDELRPICADEWWPLEGSPATYKVMRKSAKTAITDAVDADGLPARIRKARELLADADAAAEQGDYETAIFQVIAAQRKAEQAISTG